MYFADCATNAIARGFIGKISAQPHNKLCIQFLERDNNDENNRLPLRVVWGRAEILPIHLARSREA